MEKYEVSRELMQEIVDHLVGCPYNQVYKLLNQINTLKPVSTPEQIDEMILEQTRKFDFTPSEAAIPEWINEAKKD